MRKKSKKSKEEIRAIFEEACARRGLLIIVTTYLRYEAQFVHLDGNEVHASITTGGEHAMLSLGSSEVTLRFPSKLDFMEAITKLIGMGSHEGGKTIRFALPSFVFENDGRKSSRITQLGGAYATFRIGSRIIRANIIDFSATGAKIAMAQELPHSEFRVGDRIMLSIFLSENISIASSAIVRHLKGGTFGAEFSPGLSDSDMISISSWFFRQMEKERELMAHRADMEARATGAEEKPDEGGILFVTLDDELDKSLNQLFDADRKFHRVLPDATLLKNAISKAPRMVILHMADDSKMERLQLRALAEKIPQDVPILLLGTDIGGDLLFEISQTCKAAACFQWAPGRAVLLQRLVLGILKKHYGDST